MSALTGRSPRDANRVPALFAVSSADGVTVVPLEADPITGKLLVDSSYNPSGPLLIQAVSDLDGVTPVNLEANPATGALQVEGNLVVSPPDSPTANTATYTIDDTGTLILAAQVNRLGGTIFNSGPDRCYINFSGTPSVTDYIVAMIPGAYYEFPFSYTGDVSAICDTGETADITVGEFF